MYDFKYDELLINIKSLAAEARINREHARKAHGMDKWKLNDHRTGILRKEARRAHLAYAFLKGIPYSKVEQENSEFPYRFDLTSKINRFSNRKVEREEVMAWLKGE